MNKIALRVGTSLLGMIVVLAWWTLTGKKDTSHPADKIPAKVWEGGPLTLNIEVNSSSPAEMDLYLHNPPVNGKYAREMEAVEKIPAGTHSWSVEIPQDLGGRLELDAVKPDAGATLSWTISANGKQLKKESDTLKRPLQGNEAFYLQFNSEEFVQEQPEQQESSSD